MLSLRRASLTSDVISKAPSCRHEHTPGQGRSGDLEVCGAYVIATRPKMQRTCRGDVTGSASQLVDFGHDSSGCGQCRQPLYVRSCRNYRRVSVVCRVSGLRGVSRLLVLSLGAQCLPRLSRGSSTFRHSRMPAVSWVSAISSLPAAPRRPGE